MNIFCNNLLDLKNKNYSAIIFRKSNGNSYFMDVLKFIYQVICRFQKIYQRILNNSCFLKKWAYCYGDLLIGGDH